MYRFTWNIECASYCTQFITWWVLEDIKQVFNSNISAIMGGNFYLLPLWNQQNSVIPVYKVL